MSSDVHDEKLSPPKPSLSFLHLSGSRLVSLTLFVACGLTDGNTSVNGAFIVMNVALGNYGGQKAGMTFSSQQAATSPDAVFVMFLVGGQGGPFTARSTRLGSSPSAPAPLPQATAGKPLVGSTDSRAGSHEGRCWLEEPGHGRVDSSLRHHLHENSGRRA